jgi:hypothetical protein
MKSQRKAFLIGSAAYAGLWLLWIALLVRYWMALPTLADIFVGVVILLMPEGWLADYRTLAKLDRFSEATTDDTLLLMAYQGLVSHLVRTICLLTVLFLALAWTAAGR